MDDEGEENIIAESEPEQLMDNESEDTFSWITAEMERELLRDDEIHKLVNTVKDKLTAVSGDPYFERKVCDSIARVPKHLRDVNEKSYEPQIIAIGPYHRVPRIQPHLEVMEEHKILYLKMLLERKAKEDVEKNVEENVEKAVEKNVEVYVETMSQLERKARACYADTVNLKESDFVEMMLLDACFIVELFRKKYLASTSTPREDSNTVLDLKWINVKLIRDLLLVENQLPFFVLREFFEMTKMLNETNSFIEIILDFFKYRFQMHIPFRPAPDNENFCHLLNLVHHNFVYGTPQRHPIHGREVTEREDGVLRCATELQEAGIEFKMVERDTLFDIRFENGTMKVPRLTIEEDTESFFRNLIVYGQYYPKNTDLIVDYIKFMDCLINSAKDVELLCQRKIIHNCLGDDEVVANMFNRLCDSVTMPSVNYYGDLYWEVNGHCSRRHNRWMASLRHNYFNTPWALMSFIAAALLLLFTLIQTVFTVAAYFNK